jgi:hypothetical protein
VNFHVDEMKQSFVSLMREEKGKILPPTNKPGFKTVFHKKIQFAKMELKFISYFSP